MANPRIRGKIPHAEWPKIAQRFAAGESLTAIAKSYQCTAPAIRYIVRRVHGAGSAFAAERDMNVKRPGTMPQQRATGGAHPLRRQAHTEIPIANTIWSRVNSDITNFLAAVDDLFTADNEKNRQALLSATDRLLRASARTRMELERSFGGRRSSSMQSPTIRPRKAG
jgi:hypothetical protein